MCGFPGCSATSWLHAHHIVHWSNGGPTNLNNLVSLCSFHHHLVHEGGWQVEIEAGSAMWTDPNGEPAGVTPLAGTADNVETGQRHLGITPSTIESAWANDRLDFHFVVSVIAEHCARSRAHMAKQNVPAGTSPADQTSTA